MSIPVAGDCLAVSATYVHVCHNNPSKYGTLKVIQIHHVDWILFILWYVEVILRTPFHLLKEVNELLV